MSDTQEQEKALLQNLAQKPFVPRSLGYIKMTGPGLLQSAMTLGAGSAAASVVAGASFGYKMLWVQPVAMFFGVMMFYAVSNIVLTTKERPYGAFMRELGGIWGGFKILVFLWALSSVMASVIWHFPQYGLAAGATQSVVQQFAPEAKLIDGKIPKRDWFGFGSVIINKKTGETELTDKYTTLGYTVKFAAGLIILAINVIVVFNYGRGGAGIRIYEWFLRCMIALVFLTFLIVVLLNVNKIDWLEMWRGFTGYYAYETLITNYAPNTVTTVLGMLGAAVGINMTFMYPYSLLKKSWGGEHKTLAKWDLGMTMFLPFVVVTSLIMVGMTVGGIYDMENLKGLRDVVNPNIQPLDAAKALQTEWISKEVATIIFCGGLFGMVCGAVSAHMTCCGFVMCEMFGLEHTTNRFRLFALTPSIGFFGVVVNLPFWFPIAASAVCLTMLPIAYLIFLLMNNRRSYIGDAVGKGLLRWIFNALLIITLVVATLGAIVKIKTGVFDKLFPPKPAVMSTARE
jgi:Mn2+/Fe2+ NRAMP family transporter